MIPQRYVFAPVPSSLLQLVTAASGPSQAPPGAEVAQACDSRVASYIYPSFATKIETWRKHAPPGVEVVFVNDPGLAWQSARCVYVYVYVHISLYI